MHVAMITSKTHSILDYLTVLLFAIAPSLFALSETGAAIAYTLAVVHLAMTLLTAFSMGFIRVIPFHLHGYVELGVGLVLAVGPWVAGNFLTETDQLFFSIIGGVILLVWLMTTYKSPLAD